MQKEALEFFIYKESSFCVIFHIICSIDETVILTYNSKTRIRKDW